MTIANIADGLLAVLSASSAFGATAVSKNSYGVLDTSSGSCAVIQPRVMVSHPSGLGVNGPRSGVYTLNVRGFLRDTGDPQAVLDRVWSIMDTIHDAVAADETLNGAVDTVNAITINHRPGNALTNSGATWLIVDAEIGAVVY